MTTDLDGRVFLVTGANTGIGRVTARVLAERGGRVFLTARNEERAAGVLADLDRVGAKGRATLLPLELGSLSSVEACADAFLATDEPLHCLINNAGLAGATGLTTDGFEMHFGVNHLGHFLLTKLLLERLKASAPARVVTVASGSHFGVKRVNPHVERPVSRLRSYGAYASSKLANVLFSNELARRLEGTGVTTYSLHPGVIASDVWRKMPKILRGLVTRRALTVEQGAETTLYCATAPEIAEHTGRYYDHSQEVPPSAAALDEAAAAELWSLSEELVAARLPPGPPS